MPLQQNQNALDVELVPGIIAGWHGGRPSKAGHLLFRVSSRPGYQTTRFTSRSDQFKPAWYYGIEIVSMRE